MRALEGERAALLKFIELELCLLETFPVLADVLGEGKDADADDDAIVPSRRWSGRGPGEAGSIMPREYRLDFEQRSMTMGPLWMWQKVSASGPSIREPTWATERGPAPQNKTLTYICGRYACRLRSSQLCIANV